MSSQGASLEEPSIAGIPGKPSPVEVAKYVESTIRKHMMSALTPDDKEVMEQANRKLMLHATTGLWLGSTAGAVFAFRRRFMAGRAAAAAMKAGGGVGKQGVPRLFYPQQGEQGANAAGGAAQNAAKGARFGFLARGLGLGILGALIGTQVGVWTGTSAAQKIIRASGAEERIASSLQLAMDRASEEIRANSKGITIRNELLKKSAGLVGSAGSSGKWGDEQQDFEDQGGREERNRDPDAPPPINITYAPTSSASALPPSADPSPAEPSSRWDELRRSRPSTPSTWDSVRERTSRSDVPPPSINRGDQAPRAEETGMQGVDEKEERRRRFEEMMERERKGGEEQQTGEKTWR